MKSIIRFLLIFCGIGTNMFTISLIHDEVGLLFGMFIVVSNTLALTWAVVLREVFGWDNCANSVPQKSVQQNVNVLEDVA